MNKLIPALTLAALMLSGCGSHTTPATAPETTAAPTAAVTEAMAETASPYPDHTLWDVSSMSYCGYHVSSEYWMGDQDHFTLFTCRDSSGSTLWTQEAPHHNGGAQVSPTWPLGIADEKFFYYHNGVVTALDLTTGETLWQSPDTGICLAGPESAWVDDDFVCLGEFFGSNLAVLNTKGQLIREVPTLDPNLYYITRITRNGSSLTVHLDSCDFTKIPDGGPLPDGTDLTVPIDWIS